MKKIICKDAFGNTFETDSSNLILTARAYGIIIKDNKILLVRQWDGYSLPGGGIEIGEAIDEALVREVEEETGYVIEMNRIINCETVFYKSHNKEKFSHALCFYCSHKNISDFKKERKLTKNEQKYSFGAEWIDLDKLDNLTFRHGGNIKKAIEDVVINQF